MENVFPGNSDRSKQDRLRLENDLLKLKMQAELGAQFGSFSGEALPPEMEQQFLAQVMAFHQHLADNPPVALRAYLGNPEFKPASELSPEELTAAWSRISTLYEERHLSVDFLAEYPLAIRYDFLASELMDEEISPPGPGGECLCFIYEEFHPNHDFDQRMRTEEFMETFFAGRMDEACMAPVLLTDDGRQISPEEVQSLLERFHDMFAAIREWSFCITGTSAQTDAEMAEGMPRLGFTEGFLRYVVLRHDGEAQEITGPFKLYMECSHGWWQLIHFYMHGFTWGSQ